MTDEEFVKIIDKSEIERETRGQGLIIVLTFAAGIAFVFGFALGAICF